jgi:hypothetical protein
MTNDSKTKIIIFIFTSCIAWAPLSLAQERLSQHLNVNAIISDKIFIGLIEDGDALEEVLNALNYTASLARPFENMFAKGIIFTITTPLGDENGVSERVLEAFPNSLQEVMAATVIDSELCLVQALYMSNGDVFLWARMDAGAESELSEIDMARHCALLAFAFSMGANSFEVSAYSTDALRTFIFSELINLN